MLSRHINQLFWHLLFKSYKSWYSIYPGFIYHKYIISSISVYNFINYKSIKSLYRYGPLKIFPITIHRLIPKTVPSPLLSGIRYDGSLFLWSFIMSAFSKRFSKTGGSWTIGHTIKYNWRQYYISFFDWCMWLQLIIILIQSTLT